MGAGEETLDSAQGDLDLGGPTVATSGPALRVVELRHLEVVETGQGHLGPREKKCARVLNKLVSSILINSGH